MLTKRIIACLDVHGGRVVKGVRFVDLVDAGLLGIDDVVLLAVDQHEAGAGAIDRFSSITLPLMLPGIIAGMILSFARSLG